jgi:hypothetical protein
MIAKNARASSSRELHENRAFLSSNTAIYGRQSGQGAYVTEH